MTWFGDARPSGPGDNLMPLWVAGEVKGRWYLPLIFDTRKSFFFSKAVFLGGWRMKLPRPCWCSPGSLTTTIDIWVLFLSVFFIMEKKQKQKKNNVKGANAD